ncbi:hypothetical protein BDQ17DRAFT_1371821 [Cyathus striatus]|nr:hypothetical protein BDQ17DRAFT_1371821 [Cyathus striatus]
MKTADSCVNKWTHIHDLYKVILKIKAASGWTWSDEYGANITPELVSSWDDFVIANPKAKKFRNRGWKFLEQVTRIMPSVQVSDTNIFYPTQSTQQMAPVEASVSGTEEVGGSYDESRVNWDRSPEPEGDEDDLFVEESVALPATPAQQWAPKRPAIPAPPSSQKKPNLSVGTAAIASISHSLEEFNELFRRSIPVPPQPPVLETPVSPALGTLSSPTPGTSAESSMEPSRQQAVICMQRQEAWMSTSQKALFMSLVWQHLDIADMYLVTEDAALRRKWIMGQLDTI